MVALMKSTGCSPPPKKCELIRFVAGLFLREGEQLCFKMSPRRGKGHTHYEQEITPHLGQHSPVLSILTRNLQHGRRVTRLLQPLYSSYP